MTEFSTARALVAYTKVLRHFDGELVNGTSILDRLVELAEKEPTVFNQYFVGPISTEKDDVWQRYASNHQKIDAIKEYRRVYDASLLDSKNAVERWMWANGF